MTCESIDDVGDQILNYTTDTSKIKNDTDRKFFEYVNGELNDDGYVKYNTKTSSFKIQFYDAEGSNGKDALEDIIYEFNKKNNTGFGIAIENEDNLFFVTDGF